MSFLEKAIASQEGLIVLKEGSSSLVVKAIRGPSKPTAIPLILNEDLAFFSAAIIGDGHLKKSKYQICFEVMDKSLVETMRAICLRQFNRDFAISSRVNKGGRYYILYIDSKAIFQYLRDVFETPPGKKSSVVKVPQCVKESSLSIKKSFLQGLMATEGGNRRRGLGLSTASKQLWHDLALLFEDVGIKVTLDSWTHQRYKKQYYGLSFKNEFSSILSGDTEAVKRVRFRT